jgi:hypothetical protein
MIPMRMAESFASVVTAGGRGAGEPDRRSNPLETAPKIAWAGTPRNVAGAAILVCRTHPVCGILSAMKAYLDIETCAGNQITVIGIYREDRGFVQLVGGKITDVSVWDALEGADVVCTFNGDRFDLPILERQVRLDLRSRMRSMDLLRECRSRGIKGGLKRLEERFGIARATRGMNGWDAVRLWARYEQERDEEALQRLLEYNREDVMNLVALERIVVGVGLELEVQGQPQEGTRGTEVKNPIPTREWPQEAQE